MFPLVEFPELVQHYAPYFEEVFSAEAFVQFERYVSGLIVSGNKTVDGINRLFVFESRNQSSLNRLLTENPFSLGALGQARLTLLDSLPGTQMKRNGVLSVDNTRLVHYGEHLDQIACLKDPTTGCYVWAHDLVNLHYSDADTDYPVVFQLWKPTDAERLERGLVAAGIPLEESKQALKSATPTNGAITCKGCGDGISTSRKWRRCIRANSSSPSNCFRPGCKLILRSRCRSSLTTGTPSPAPAASWTRLCSCLMWGR